MKKLILTTVLVFYSVIFLNAGEHDVQIWDQEIKWIEVGDYYARYSWKVKLRNNTNIAKKIYIKFELLDKNDFIVDWSNDNVNLGAFESKWFSGTSMMKTRLAKQVKKTNVKITIR
ncbi:MAG: hypothetical protein RAO92_05485 [Candidatus Euphemobacter frigidus]|nr:hypothetical protein [Candidatus Euphemobacter frigidus]MDP8275838.1 hypothetical protein [Candidatus Euphemobacter frigidus]